MKNSLTKRLTGISIDVTIVTDKGKNGDKTDFYTKNDKKEIPIIDKFLKNFYISRKLDKLEGSTAMRVIESISPSTSTVELYVAIEFKDQTSLALALPLIEDAQKELALNIKNAWAICQEYSARREARIPSEVPFNNVPLAYHEETLSFLDDANFYFNILLNNDVLTIPPPAHIAPIIRDSNVPLEESTQLVGAIFEGYDVRGSKTIRISSPDLNGHYKSKQYTISNTCDKFKELTKGTYASVVINITLKLSGDKYFIDTYEVLEDDDLFD